MYTPVYILNAELVAAVQFLPKKNPVNFARITDTKTRSNKKPEVIFVIRCTFFSVENVVYFFYFFGFFRFSSLLSLFPLFFYNLPIKLKSARVHLYISHPSLFYIGDKCIPWLQKM